MDNQAKLEGLLRQQSELKEVIEQALYSVELNLRTKEYGFMAKAANIAANAQNELFDVDRDIKRVRQDIEDETREDLL